MKADAEGVHARGSRSAEGAPRAATKTAAKSAFAETTVNQQHLDLGAPLISLAVFSLEGHRYGLTLAAAERVLPMVAISPLPGCPEVVLGAINLHGDIIPVLDARRRLGLPGAEYGPAACLLIARTPRRVVALPVDDVQGVVEVAADSIVRPDAVLPGIEHVSGVAALADGLLLIHDLDAFLSLEQERDLAESLGEKPL